MTDPMTFNQALQWFPHKMGWWFWAPMLIYGAWGLWYLYRLAPAAAQIVRVIRVVFTLAFLCMGFTVIYDGLGPYACYLLALGVCLWLKRAYEECLRAGKIKKSRAPTMVERMAEAIVERKII